MMNDQRKESKKLGGTEGLRGKETYGRILEERVEGRKNK